MSKPVAVFKANCGCGFVFVGKATDTILAAASHTETTGHQSEVHGTVHMPREVKAGPMARFATQATRVVGPVTVGGAR